MNTVEVSQVREGTPRKIRNRYGVERTIQIDREWSVAVDGKEVGRVRYRMIRRERVTRRSGVVDARWHVPGWEYEVRDRWVEKPSKKACIEAVLMLARDPE